jgi:hypothetical protein
MIAEGEAGVTLGVEDDGDALFCAGSSSGLVKAEECSSESSSDSVPVLSSCVGCSILFSKAFSSPFSPGFSPETSWTCYT